MKPIGRDQPHLPCVRSDCGLEPFSGAIHQLLVIWIVAITLMGCSTGESVSWSSTKDLVRTSFPTVPQLATGELARWLADADREPPLLIDARSQEEFEVSHLPNAQHATELAAAEELLVGASKERPIVVYCAVGYRSGRLAEQLQSAGWENVYNLEGSIFQWANEGRPVVDSAGSADQVHPYDETWGQLLDRRLHWTGGE